MLFRRFTCRFTVWTGGFGVATIGFDFGFLKGWGNEIDSITEYVGVVGKRVVDAGMHRG